MRVFCGIDWAEDHHDVALVDIDGKLIAKRRISDDATGFALLLELFAEASDNAEDPIPVAIETGRGLLVACLRATGRRMFAIDPLAVSRYRDRHSVARKKSDAGDALVLAHVLRTDMAKGLGVAVQGHADCVDAGARDHRDTPWPAPAGSEHGQGVVVNDRHFRRRGRDQLAPRKVVLGR